MWLIAMIYEPHTERNYSLWVDGHLPTNDKLEEIISNLISSHYFDNMDDTHLAESFDDQLGENYHHLQRDRKKRPTSYVHILKPSNSLSLPGSFNPIADEFGRLKNRKDYRLFGLFAGEFMDDPDKDMKSLKESFLKTINDYQFEVKKEESYRKMENVKSQFTEISKFILDCHFFPYTVIRTGLRSLGFKSEEIIF